MTVPREPLPVLSVLFGANLAAYCINLLDETLMAGGFVAGVQAHFWPSYTAGKFFALNTVFLILIAASNIAYDLRGGRFILLPLIWVWERALNGLWHLGWTAFFREYSPGLVTSVLFWIVFAFTYRYGVLGGGIATRVFLRAGMVALIIEALLLSSLWWAQELA
jgi:hypothetical protein